MTGRVLLAAVLATLAADAASAQTRKPIERMVITPQNAILAPGGRLTLEAWATVRGEEQNIRVPCRWRLLAQRGLARLAVQRSGRPSVAAVIEAGVAPAFVVVEARHTDADGFEFIAKTTVLCSKPLLVAPARIAVSEPAPIELSLPLLPAARNAQITIETLEEPAGGDTRYVRMRDGEFGPVGGNYAVKMPVRGGSVQVGMRVQVAGRYRIRGRIRVDEYDLVTEPITVEAVPIVSIKLAAYHPGPPTATDHLQAGLAGHGIPGPYVVSPPQAVAPVVLGFGPDGEPLGILGPASSYFGKYVNVGGRQRLRVRRLPLGMQYIAAKSPARPVSGAAVRRTVSVSIWGAVGRTDPKKLRTGFVVCEPLPLAVVPIPAGGSVHLGIVLTGRAEVLRLAPLQGRSAYAIGDAGKAILEVDPLSAVDAIITARAPGLARIRSRCQLNDIWGNTSKLRLVTEFLVVAPGSVVLCGPDGRPVERAADAAWAVAGVRKVLRNGDGAATVVLPTGSVSAGKARKLQRVDGELWIVPVRRRAD